MFDYFTTSGFQDPELNSTWFNKNKLSTVKTDFHKRYTSSNYVGMFAGFGGELYYKAKYSNEHSNSLLSEEYKRHIYKLNFENVSIDLTHGWAGFFILDKKLCKISTEFQLNSHWFNRVYSYFLDESFKYLSSNQEMYLGAAHGIAGLLYPLSIIKIYNKKTINLIENIISKLWEEQLYNEEESLSLWSVLNSPESRIMQGWCSGAPGILMSLVYLKKSNIYSKLTQVTVKMLNILIERALEGTRKIESNSVCVCCGDLSRILALGNYYQNFKGLDKNKIISLFESLKFEQLNPIKCIFKGELGKDFILQCIKKNEFNLPILPC